MAPKKKPSKATQALVPTPRGRPHELTPEMHAAIVRYLEGGNYVTTAAELAGVHRSTFFAWMQRGNRGEQPFADLLDAVKKARAKAKAAMLAVVLRSAMGTADNPPQWQAAAWFLERTSPDEFGKRVRVITDDEVDRAGAAAGDDERIDLSRLSVDELRTLQDMRKKARVVRTVGTDEDA